MRRAHRSLWVAFFLLTTIISMCAQQPTLAERPLQGLQLASLRPRQQLIWRRVSPAAGQIDGPVLYTLIIRSSATPNHIPRIASNYTLTNSLIGDDGTNVTIGGLSIDGNTGLVSFAGSQAFPGTGTVTSTPTGISCGSLCSASYTRGQKVVLKASAGSRFKFSGWTGACTGTSTCTVTMTAARAVGATFTPR